MFNVCHEVFFKIHINSILSEKCEMNVLLLHSIRR